MVYSVNILFYLNQNAKKTPSQNYGGAIFINDYLY